MVETMENYGLPFSQTDRGQAFGANWSIIRLEPGLTSAIRAWSRSHQINSKRKTNPNSLTHPPTSIGSLG